MSTMCFTAYDPTTGRICWTGYCSTTDLEHQGVEGIEVITDQYDGDVWYCPEGIPTLRPELSFDKTTIAADGVDKATMSMVPGTFTVRIDGEAYEDSDDLVFVSTSPGTYLIELDRFPYLPFVGEITVE